MSAETKVGGAGKAARCSVPKIGYPDKWRDYSALDVSAGDAFGNDRAQRDLPLELRTRAPDQAERSRRMVHDAANRERLLQSDLQRDRVSRPPSCSRLSSIRTRTAAVNYGGIGAVIGHEMGHGFDDQGAKSDGHGVLRDWWSAGRRRALSPCWSTSSRRNTTRSSRCRAFTSTAASPQAKTSATMAACKSRIMPITYSLNGQRRAGDRWRHAAISVSSSASRKCGGRKYRDAAVRNQVMTDPHSPSQYPLQRHRAEHGQWYAAFNVQPGDQMYVAQDQRVKIW